MRISPICLAILVAAACTPRVHTDSDTGAVDVDMQPVTQGGEIWNSTLAGQPGFTEISGTAEATVNNEQTSVSITLNGATPGSIHPWHVHEGTCGSGGAIVGPADAYPPLQVGSQGQAMANAQLALSLNEAATYHVNVHASPTDMGTIVACGPLDD